MDINDLVYNSAEDVLTMYDDYVDSDIEMLAAFCCCKCTGSSAWSYNVNDGRTYSYGFATGHECFKYCRSWCCSSGTARRGGGFYMIGGSMMNGRCGSPQTMQQFYCR